MFSEIETHIISKHGPTEEKKYLCKLVVSKITIPCIIKRQYEEKNTLSHEPASHKDMIQYQAVLPSNHRVKKLQNHPPVL